ncbi:MAG: bifunctional nuclease family protein [Planctomycetia bacterium]|nr:bifunctional nuclease family protein [Planctomycetia bacterium]
MELRRIVTDDVREQYVIYLKEVEGDRIFPIVIGLFEVVSIERRVKGVPTPRPLTHDLICEAIEKLDGTIQDVMISSLREGTYYAKIRVVQHGKLIEIDSRPSDAIAIAVTAEVPIYVNEAVLKESTERD